MALPPATRRALDALDLAWHEDEPLGPRVYWKVGGPADGYAEVADLATLGGVLEAAHETGCPVFVLGKGSNLLVSDAGIRGLVIHLGGALADTRVLGGDPPPPAPSCLSSPSG